MVREQAARSGPTVPRLQAAVRKLEERSARLISRAMAIPLLELINSRQANFIEKVTGKKRNNPSIIDAEASNHMMGTSKI